jgi:flagellar basal-body rod modification protein FlgD
MVNPISTGKTLEDLTIPTSQRTNGTKLGQQDFLKVMVEQMRNQNPLEPQNNNEFFTQMVQFQSLDAMTAISAQLKSLVEVGGLANAAALIGKTVKASVDKGADPRSGMPLPPEEVSGVVSSVTFENGSPVVHVGNKAIPASMVDEVS